MPRNTRWTEYKDCWVRRKEVHFLEAKGNVASWFISEFNLHYLLLDRRWWGWFFLVVILQDFDLGSTIKIV